MRKAMTGRGHVSRVPLVLSLIASCLAAGCAYGAEETPAQPAASAATTGTAVARSAALPAPEPTATAVALFLDVTSPSNEVSGATFPNGAVSTATESDGTDGGRGDGPATNRAVDFDPARLIGGVGTQFVPLTDPEFVVAAADFLDTSDIVIGLSVGDEHRAYPVRQIAYHHIVNDTVGGVPRVITY